jgi:hypothetical protein
MTETNKKQHLGKGAVDNVVQSTSDKSISPLDLKRQQLQDAERFLEELVLVRWTEQQSKMDAVYLRALESLDARKEHVRSESDNGRLTAKENDDFKREKKSLDLMYKNQVNAFKRQMGIAKKEQTAKIRKLEREIEQLEKTSVKTRDANIAEMNEKAKGMKGRTDRAMFLLYPDSAPEDWRSRLENTGVAIVVSPFHNRDIDRGKTVPKKAHWHVIALYKEPMRKGEIFRTFARALEGPNGPEAVNTIVEVNFIEGMYNYLTHNTDKARADGKAQYDPKDILTFNGFEELYEQKLLEDGKKPVGQAVSDLILRVGFPSVNDMIFYVEQHEKELPFTRDEVVVNLRNWSNAWKTLCGGPWQPHMPPRDSVPERSEEGEQGE